jgi:hypothetical protein
VSPPSPQPPVVELMPATITEYRASHWGTAKTGWIPLGGLTRHTLELCMEAVKEHCDRWHDGPFRITEATITTRVVATYPDDSEPS